MKLLFTSLLGLILLGCGSSDKAQNTNSSNANDNVYKQNLSKWNDLNITSYTFNYEYKGIFQTNGKWKIQVTNKKVSKVSYVGNANSTNESLSIEKAPTIDYIFKDMLDCYNGVSCSLEAKFDDNFFFPTYVYISTSKDGWSYTITDFKKQ